MFLSALILTASAFAAPIQEKVQAIDMKRVEAAVVAIDAAFKEGKTSDERIAAIKQNYEVADPKVAAAVAKGLKDKDAAVKMAAIDALGRMPVPSALESLHQFFRADKQKLKDDETLLPLVLKSIGRHGSEKSIEILADDPFMQRTFPALQARVLSLGNIRSKKSVEALMEMMVKGGERQVNDYMNLFRQSLVRLTGQDQGPDSGMWTNWWQGAKNKFEMSKEVPQIPEIAQQAWNEYWEIKPMAK